MDGQTGWAATLAAVALATMVALCMDSPMMARLAAVGRQPESNRPSPIGIAATLASAIARIRGGGSLVEAFEEQGQIHFATRQLTVARIAAALRRRKMPRETDAQIIRTARQVCHAATLSDRLGCRSSEVLQAVSSTHRREQLAEDRRNQAFAAPEATIQLLSALPAVTVGLGEVLGARPLTFLFSSLQGLACLCLGAIWYSTGLIWVRHMLAGLGTHDKTGNRSEGRG